MGIAVRSPAHPARAEIRFVSSVWSPGEAALFRTVAFGHVRFAMPHIVVEATIERVLLWLPPGAEGKRFAGRPMWEIEDLAGNDWSLDDYTWRGGGCLKLWHHGDSHSLWHFWDESHTEFRGWYVNLEDPWSETSLGWDTRDLALDLVVEPDGSWRWKDEDHFAAAVERGWITPTQASAIRAEAERVIEARPWPSGWETWRPDQRWAQKPQLPGSWDLL